MNPKSRRAQPLGVDPHMQVVLLQSAPVVVDKTLFDAANGALGHISNMIAGKQLTSFAIIAICIFLTLAFVGCQRYSKVVRERSEKFGIPLEKEERLWHLLEVADSNEGLTEKEWSELERYAQDSNQAVKLESVVVVGGISAKKTNQKERVIKFLKDRASDTDSEVRRMAEGLLPIFLPESSTRAGQTQGISK
ncbi:MAG: hypothetical protein ACKVQS_07205 [Fimbriimonadaceae bacterium]